MTCVYLSGPMTGKPDFNSAEFAHYAAKYRALGYSVLSPPEMDNGVTDLPYAYYLRRDIQTLLDGVQRVYMLPGWETSRGAKLEQEIAHAIDVPVYDAETDEPLAAGGFTVKDSGVRQMFASGMVRDVTAGKIDYALAVDGPMFKRYAVHLTKGARKYDKRNWMKASGSEELERYRESAFRHFMEWFFGNRDEDHAAAVLFNINGAEYVRDRMPQTDGA